MNSMTTGVLAAFQVLILIGSFSSVILLYILWKKTESSLAKSVFQFYGVFFVILFVSFSLNWIITVLFNKNNAVYSSSFSFYGQPRLFAYFYPLILILNLFSPALLPPFAAGILQELFSLEVFGKIKKVITYVCIGLVISAEIFTAVLFLFNYLGKPLGMITLISTAFSIFFAIIVYGGLGCISIITLILLPSLEKGIIKSVLKSFLTLIGVFLPLIAFEQISYTLKDASTFFQQYYTMFPSGFQFQWFMFLGISILCHFNVLKALMHLEPVLPAVPMQKPIDRIREANLLSAREIEIIEHSITGISNKEIALLLNISHATVKNHLSNAYKKLGVSSRWDLLKDPKLD